MILFQIYMSHNGTYGVAIMIGASFYWFISGFREDYKYFASKRFERRNLWTAYFLQLFFVAIIGIIVWVII
ncbi:hypothetical protein QQ008_17290 [Fulvivirgaceae bacterium BMA10]|uniref:Uncharacterized protein n=1 Tax=Splendidivirga corallicola TaxID=3051826 RepID=A0ABT8KU38_9BACT|nr:hypothetical protein [Fulvivirgaceae bacterium BMA10]